MAESTRLANPAPLGLAGFGMTTILLSLINADVLPHTGEKVVVPLALAYGGAIQILAGMLEFRVGNTFGMTAFLSYGAFWWWFALMLIFDHSGMLPLKDAGSTIGVALLLWGALTMYLWVGTFRLPVLSLCTRASPKSPTFALATKWSRQETGQATRLDIRRRRNNTHYEARIPVGPCRDSHVDDARAFQSARLKTSIVARFEINAQRSRASPVRFCARTHKLGQAAASSFRSWPDDAGPESLRLPHRDRAGGLRAK